MSKDETAKHDRADDATRLRRVSQRWRDLAERRCAHFTEMHRSGRWKHYYTEAEFLRAMREVIDAANKWAQITGPRAPADGPAPAE